MAELSVDLLAAMVAVDLEARAFAAEPSRDEIPGGTPPATGPGLAEFLRFVVEIDKPLLSTGEMSFSASGRLEKRTLTPKPEMLVLDGDVLSIERDKQKLTIHLASQPEALAFIDSIRGTLTGNRAALERNYLLHLAGTSDQWTLTLLPSEPKIAAATPGRSSTFRSVIFASSRE